MPALAAFTLSIVFTAFAVNHPAAATIVACPTAIIAVALMWWQSKKTRGRV